MTKQKINKMKTTTKLYQYIIYNSELYGNSMYLTQVKAKILSHNQRTGYTIFELVDDRLVNVGLSGLIRTKTYSLNAKST